MSQTNPQRVDWLVYCLIFVLATFLSLARGDIKELKRENGELELQFSYMRSVNALMLTWQIEDLRKKIELQELLNGMYQ